MRLTMKPNRHPFKLTLNPKQPIFEQSLLPLNFAECDEYMVHCLADEALLCGEFVNWDHAYESIWAWLEYELHVQTKEKH